MTPATILYLHGFASSAQGTKARFLQRRLAGRDAVSFHALEFNPTPTDFAYLTTTGMINRLRQYLLDRGLAGAAPPDRVFLVGSSMGGLVALNYAHRFGGIAALLLLAPALSYLSGERTGADMDTWRERGTGEVYHFGFQRRLPLRYDIEIDGRNYAEAPPPAAPTIIIHGTKDEVVPFATSRAYAARFPALVRLLAVEASHSGLNEHLDLIWQQLHALLSEPTDQSP